jgi:hypothetical protein
MTNTSTDNSVDNESLVEKGAKVPDPFSPKAPGNGALFKTKECPRKAEVILSWVADATEHTLKKVCVILAKEKGIITTRGIHFSAMVKRPEFFWQEEARAVLESVCER